jgi:8-oxo-dGTP diphosphatase
MNKFNESEFVDVCQTLNVEQCISEVELECSRISFFNRMKNFVESDRRGEVVFCVIRPNGRIITTACADYPENIYRIPTGGLGHSEDVIKAVRREVMEELGIDIEIIGFAGVLKIRLKYGDDSVMFYSYLFILKEVGGKLLEDALDNEISQVKEVDVEGLRQVIESLYNAPGSWNDWGKFRHITSKAILSFLLKAEKII